MANSNSSFFDGGVIGSGPDDLLGGEDYNLWDDTGANASSAPASAAIPDVIGADQRGTEAASNSVDLGAASDLGAKAPEPVEKVGDVMSGLHDDDHRKDKKDDLLDLGGGKDDKKESDAPVSDINNAVGAPPASNFDPMGLMQPFMQLGQLLGQAPQQMMQPMQQMMQPMQQMMQQLPQQMQSLMGQSGQGWQGSASDSAMKNMGAQGQTLDANSQQVQRLMGDAEGMAQDAEEAGKKHEEAAKKGQEGAEQAQQGTQSGNPVQAMQGFQKNGEALGEATANISEHTGKVAQRSASATEKAMPQQPPDISKLLGPLQSMMQMPMQMLQQAPQMLQGLAQMPQQLMQGGMQAMQGLMQAAGKGGGAGNPAAAGLGDSLTDGGKLEGSIDSTANIGGLGGGGLGGLGGGGGGGGHERALSAAGGSANMGGGSSSGGGPGGIGGGAASAGSSSLSTRPAGMGGGGGMGMMPQHHGAGESKGGSKVPDYLKGSVLGQNQLGDIPQVAPSVLGGPHEGEGESVHG